MCLYLHNPFTIESPIKTRFAWDVDADLTKLVCKFIQPCLLYRGKLCIVAMFKKWALLLEPKVLLLHFESKMASDLQAFLVLRVLHHTQLRPTKSKLSHN